MLLSLSSQSETRECDVREAESWFRQAERMKSVPEGAMTATFLQVDISAHGAEEAERS